MNKLQQISEYFNKLSEECGSNPQVPPMNRPPQMMAPPMNRPPMPQPNSPLSPNQLNDPNFIAQIVNQVIQQMQNQGGMQEQIDDEARKRMAQDAASLGKGREQTPQLINMTVDLKMDSEIGKPVTVEYDPKKNLRDVTISWGNESHSVDFEAGDVIDDHGNEGSDIETMAESDDGRWQFILDVYVGYQFKNTGDFEDWDFNELIVQSHPDNEDHLDPEDRSDWPGEDEAGMAPRVDMDEGTCGHTQTADGKKLKTPGGTKGVSGLNRTNFMRNQQN